MQISPENIAQIAVDVPLSRQFDYLAPGISQADIGRRALVPFGRRLVVGVIVGIAHEPTDPAFQLKCVKEIFYDVPPLPPAILQLARFCSEYYHYPLGQVLATLLPVRLRRTQPVGALTEARYGLTHAGRDATADALPKRALVKQKLLAALQASGSLTHAEITRLSPSANKAVQAFATQGWVTITQEPLTAAARNHTLPASLDAPTLNPEQQQALDALRAVAAGFSAWLLHGVTGSGKTEVYLHLIEDILARGGQVLVLVPEINLTPQLESRFQARFPQTTIVSLHSNLAEGERLKHWLMAQQGAAQIVLGTRLAVFTPMPKLQLIVVDEEHDASFKQQDGMRYSARDVAVFRAREAGVPILLGSATPALESYHNALNGRYRLLTLQTRAVTDAAPPTVHCIDLRREALMEGFSTPLISALKQRIKRGEQSLLFINRRGFAPVLMCGGCGWLAGCTRCSSRLVVHLKEQRLRCHHCGHEERLPRACPSCGNVDLAPVGQGTQRLEATLEKLMPEARILRVDRDSTRRKNSLPEMLEKVHAEEVDILVGTQMLAKGHDFPKLTLVGILNADGGLYSADFRASERLFAQLLQVAGRAGRASSGGEVLIQTAFPEHPLFAALKHGDYAAFAQTLLAEREQAGLPPYAYQAMLRAEASQLDAALKFLRRAAALAQPTAAITLYDPVSALMPRRAAMERAQLLVESHSRAALQQFLKAWLPQLESSAARTVRWALDVDPIDA
ncbi:MAG: primosomal protein N' [Burkholderiales bacterium]|nr:primosomal protein N' [Burkholderiales bacterium]